VSAVVPIEPPPALSLQSRIVETHFAARALEGVLEGLWRAGRVRLFQPARRAAVASVAATLALEPEDQVFGTARDWPAALARGVTFEALALQVFGKAGDPGLGRTLPGAVHDAGRRLALSDSGPAAHLLHAAGFGLGAALRGDDVVALAFFGSAALAQSDAHAAFNLAPVRRARAVFVARGPRATDLDLEAGADAWGMPVITVDGDHGAAVHRAVRRARQRALAGDGPTLVDARHGEADPIPWDVLALQRAGSLSAESERALEAEIRLALGAARRAAESAGHQDPESLRSHLLASVEDRP